MKLGSNEPSGSLPGEYHADTQRSFRVRGRSVRHAVRSGRCASGFGIGLEFVSRDGRFDNRIPRRSAARRPMRAETQGPPTLCQVSGQEDLARTLGLPVALTPSTLGPPGSWRLPTPRDAQEADASDPDRLPSLLAGRLGSHDRLGSPAFSVPHRTYRHSASRTFQLPSTSCVSSLFWDV